MKHQEQEERVGENAQEHDGQAAIERAGGQPQPDRRRFLTTGGALAVGGAAAYSIPGVAMAGSGAGLSPAAPLRGQHFRATIPNPQQLKQHEISIPETPTPYTAGTWENTLDVPPVTHGTFVLRYTGIDNQPYEVTAEVEVDNITQVLTVGGMPAHTLADVFNADMPVPPKDEAGELEIDWELVVLLLILLLVLILLDPTYETDANNPVETSDDCRPGVRDRTQAENNTAVAGLGLVPAPTKQPGDGPTDSYNCHGFVFTKGDRCIGKKPDGSDIQKILDDNGYAKRAPGTVQEGDLAVYHDGTKLTHTGVVTGVAAGAATEVHSKWGPWARYKHAPGSVPPSYGTANYYHSARLGHNLR